MADACTASGGGGGGGGGDGVGELLVWQIVDSGLPTGGFAHSLGLEAAAAAGFVIASDGPSPGVAASQQQQQMPMELAEFIDGQVQNLAALELPFVAEAHASAADAEDAEDDESAESAWARLDRLLAVRTHPNAVAMRASCAQGSALLRIAAGGLLENPAAVARVEAMRARIQRGGAHGLFAPVFGVVARLLGIDVRTAQKMYLYLGVRDMVSAAKRLALIGPAKGVALQRSLAVRVQRHVDTYAGSSTADAHQPFPLGDILHSTHDTQFRKMFLS